MALAAPELIEAESRGKRPWLLFALIVAASACAHLWCLGSQFYMDDMTQIRDSEAIRNGEVLDGLANLWTRLGYVIQYQLFGMSPVGFHVVNWLLHTAVACVLFGLGRDFVRGKMPEGVALFGALLFAVHPLASEIPNYTRTQDLAWVTLFSLLASWALLRFLRDGGWRKLVWTALGIIGATLSKGPGFFHAVMMAGAVGLAFMTAEQWRFVRRHVWWGVGVSAGGAALFWITHPGWYGTFDKWSQPRFIGHAYTLARVFWEFAWRAVIPVKLCSDHQIAESLVPPGSRWFNIPDKTAMWAAAAMLALTAVSLVLAWRKPTRLFGVCLFLFVATILFRMTYLIPEFMPEYRIYPGMPWFCLGAAIFLGWAWRSSLGNISPKAPVILLLAVFAVMSARRSFVWHDLDTLCGDVLKHYPANARAIWELDDRDMESGRWQQIIDRQRTIWPVVFQSFIAQSKRLAPGRDLNSGNFALADIACNGRYAIALAHAANPAAGVAEIRRLEARMHALGINPETNRVIWGYFHHARATVMEMAGAYPQALESMRFEGVFQIKPADLERVEKKLAEKNAGPW